ncbi:hypothetical protein PFISCL1PPCAC_12926, partial [Pristionchus fissidentatus]
LLQSHIHYTRCTQLRCCWSRSSPFSRPLLLLRPANRDRHSPSWIDPEMTENSPSTGSRALLAARRTPSSHSHSQSDPSRKKMPSSKSSSVSPVVSRVKSCKRRTSEDSPLLRSIFDL